MKKILIVAPFLDVGGRERHINLIAKYLRDNYKITVLSTHTSTFKSLAFNDLDMRQCKILDKAVINSNLFLFLLSLASYIWNMGFNRDLYFFLNNNFIKKNKLKKSRLKCINKFIIRSDMVLIPAMLNEDFVNYIIEFSRKNKKKILLNTITEYNKTNIGNLCSISQIDLFIHHSKENANILSSLLKKTNFKHFYEIIDQSIFNDTDYISSIALTKNKNLVCGFIGRLDDNKNIKQIVNFFKKYSQYEFVCAGVGKYSSYISDVSTKFGNITFLGEILNHEIICFYKDIDILLIASNHEGGPFVGLEAMAAGKIIISTKVGAMEKRLEGTRNDFWIDQNNLSESLFNIIKIISSLNNLELEKIGESNRNKYFQNYSFEITKIRYINTIKNVLKSRNLIY